MNNVFPAIFFYGKHRENLLRAGALFRFASRRCLRVGACYLWGPFCKSNEMITEVQTAIARLRVLTLYCPHAL
jgi:hypothetical protein